MEKTTSSYLMHQESYSKGLQELTVDFTIAEFRSFRQELACLTSTRPDICASVNLATQVRERTWSRKDVRELNRATRYFKEPPQQGLFQQEIDLELLYVKVIAASSFSNTPSLHS